jgi:Ran-binding protein 1
MAETTIKPDTSSETEKPTTGVTGGDKENAGATTYTEAAANAASGVKDSVFSMFGGGAKKEKKVEEDDADEPSGSSKNKKAAEEVRRDKTCKGDRARTDARSIG